MLKVIAHIDVYPECMQEVLPIQQEAVEVTRQEPGCLEYALYQNVEIPNIITFVSEWASEEAYQAHAMTPYLTEKNRRLAGMIRSKDIQLFKML